MSDALPEVDLSIRGGRGAGNAYGQVSDEWHPRLKGRRGAKTYREISDNDPLIGGFLLLIKNAIRQVEFDMQASGETSAHAKEAMLVRAALFDDMSMTWDDTLSDIITFPTWGWAALEIVYKLRLGQNSDPRKRSRFSDGRIGWRKFALRKQETIERWSFDDDSGLNGAFFTSDVGSSFIPIDKMLLFRTESNGGNPEGRSLLRNAVTSWWKKKRLEEIEAVGAERDLVGMPCIKVPPRIMTKAATAPEKQLRADLEILVQQIRRDEREGLVIPNSFDENGNQTGYDFALVTSGGSRQIDLNKSIVRYEQRMLTSVAHQFLLLGQNEKGSFALADSQTDVAGYVMAAFLDTITAVFNRFAIPRLETLNKVPQDLWPHMVHGDVEKPALQELADYVQKLISAGAISPSDEMEQVLLDYGGLPQPEPVEPSLRPGSLEDMPFSAPTVETAPTAVTMNGAQVQALVQIVQQAAKGEIPKESAIEIIAIAFPTITKEQAAAILG